MQMAREICGLGSSDAFGSSDRSFLQSQFLAFGKIKLSRTEDWDLIDSFNRSRHPKIGNANCKQPLSDLIQGQFSRSEQHKRFPFRLVRHTGNRHDTFVFPFQPKDFDDLRLDRLVWRHLSGDLRKTREATLDVEKTIFVESSKISSLETAVLKNFGCPLGLA